MDKRYIALPFAEQDRLRQQAIDEVLAHPDWTLLEAIRHLKKVTRMATSEMAELAGVGYRTLQDIEHGRSEGTVQTMSRVFGAFGLKLSVARSAAEPPAPLDAVPTHPVDAD